MIYLDTSVALAHLLAEDRAPQARMWQGPLVSTRLLEYEVWNRIHARGLTATHGEATRALLDRVAMLKMAPDVLGRALEPFPLPVRTLDALHLASVEFPRAQGQSPSLASCDDTRVRLARSMGIPILPL